MANTRPTTCMADARPTKTTATTNSCGSVFDRLASDAVHLHEFLLPANPGYSGHFPATNQLFGSVEPNAALTDMRAALRGKRPVGVANVIPASISSPLALRPRDAAKALGISPRLLWQLTHDG